MQRNDATRTPFTMSRRGLLKAVSILALAGLAAPISSRIAPAHAAALKADGSKTLIVYYSRTGNTREMAGLIRQRTGGDILELHTVTPYPSDYKATTEQAKREQESGYLPPLQPIQTDVLSYDVIFVGSPSWWATLAPPVKTFLTSYDLSGKTLVPFVTHGGTGMGRNASDTRDLCPNATVLAGLALRGSNIDERGSDVDDWLRTIGLAR